MQINNICCIGAGYVGGPTMAVIAQKNPQLKITVVDANPDRIKAWNGPLDQLPVYEPGLAEVVKQTRDKNLFFSEDIAGNIEKAEMIFMAVNTPTKTEGEGAGMAADLSYIEACAKDIAKYSKTDKIVVEKSTVPIRTAEKIKEILEQNSTDIHFEILSNPEFLAEGTAISDMKSPDRVLIGGDDTESGQYAVKFLVDIYANWIPKEKILTTNVWSSELTKLASNAMLAQRISSINSLSALCEKTGANIEELSKAIGMDHRIGSHFLKASVGFGGSCFQKDILNLVYLCKYYGLDKVAEYWHQVVKINDFQKDRFAQKIIKYFDERNIKNKQITILGWAFKANTNDSRESASISITAKLLENNISATVFDPSVKKNDIIRDLKIYWSNNLESKEKINYFLSMLEVNKEFKYLLSKTTTVAILTEWEIFKELDKTSLRIFDGRNLLVNHKNIVFSIGRGLD